MLYKSSGGAVVFKESFLVVPAALAVVLLSQEAKILNPFHRWVYFFASREPVWAWTAERREWKWCNTNKCF